MIETKTNAKKGKFIGVGYSTQYRYYIARIRYDGITRHIGSFKDEVEAAQAYDRESKLHVKNGRLNFPEPEPFNPIPDTRRIRLTQGKWALVDSCDYERVNQFQWNASEHNGIYYAFRTIRENGKRTTLPLHRFISGVTDPNIKIDHEDRDGLNNTRKNLRPSTNQQNSINQIGCDKSSQFKGVYYNKEKQKYTAQIKVNYKSRHIGYFVSEIEAAEAYDCKAKELFGEFAYLNFPWQ